MELVRYLQIFENYTTFFKDTVLFWNVKEHGWPAISF